MGIVNVTPDSFSDGGAYLDPGAAVAHGLELAAAGAAVIDVGGESTRPGAAPVDADEELRRVLPVVRALADRVGVPVSIDTTKAAVARAALDAGARMVNDVSGGTADPELVRVAAAAGAAYVAMHMRGTPRTMQDSPHYDDVVGEVCDELRVRVAHALEVGVDARALLVDPGIGFAKTAAHNVTLLRALPEVAARVGMPVLVGTSRKSFLARIVAGTGDPMVARDDSMVARDDSMVARDDSMVARDDATLATTVWCFEQGAALVRVHDVAGSRRAVALLETMDRATPEGIAA
jgi:dihydropteroate synthase